MSESIIESELTSPQEDFFNLFANHIDSPYESDLLRKKRLKSWDHLQELGFPDRSKEAFQYLDLDKIYSECFVKAEVSELKKDDVLPFVLPESKESYLVFANGSFRPELSNFSAAKESVLIPLNQASRTFASILQGSWAKSLKEEVDPFATLNNACHHDGLFFYLPPNQKITSHIQLLHINDIEQPSWVMPRVHIVLGKGSEVTFVETTHSNTPGVTLFDNRVIDILIEDGASCTFAQYLHDHTGIVLSSVRALLKRDAKLTTTSVADADFSRLSLHVQLAGTGAEASLHGVNMLSKTKEGHVHVVIDHHEPHCRSMQLFKNVLNDSARSSFEGKIWVRQKAQKTEAYQLNNNLILNANAEACSKPNLEIFADDVKASHGATSGQLDEEQLFYLKTRGLSDEIAKACLIQGFCQEVVNLLPNKTLRQKAHQLIVNLYGRSHQA